MTVIVLCVERWIALAKAKGKGNTTKFVEDVKAALRNHDIAKAEDLCRKQKGTVGAVVYATLQKYKEMEKDTILSKEQKVASIQATLEEATALACLLYMFVHSYQPLTVWITINCGKF